MLPDGSTDCETQDSKPDSRPARVLLIDDNEGFTHFVDNVLTREHEGLFEMEGASDLESGLEILEGSRVDVLLLDLGLPDSGGFRTFRVARARVPDVPIIILTCLDDEELAVDAVREGAQDYLVKDRIDAELLVRAIRYAIERAGTERMLRRMSARVLQLQDEERRRIARELHDTTAQTLAALSMNLSLLKQSAGDLTPEARALLDESTDYVEECSSELRTLSYLLHPPLLDEFGLAGAVRKYADGFALRSGIRVDLELPKSLRHLPEEHATALFRTMQEALVNIHRHSGSATASICLSANDGEVRLEVRDKGCGIPEGAVAGTSETGTGLGVGIAGMRERLRQLGGRLEIHGEQSGTTIATVLPLSGKA